MCIYISIYMDTKEICYIQDLHKVGLPVFPQSLEGQKASEGYFCLFQPQAKFDMPTKCQSPKTAPPNHRSAPGREWNHFGWDTTSADCMQINLLLLPISFLLFLVLALHLTPPTRPGSPWFWRSILDTSLTPGLLYSLSNTKIWGFRLEILGFSVGSRGGCLPGAGCGERKEQELGMNHLADTEVYHTSNVV